MSYPRCSREELGGGFLGLMTYPDPKGERNSSMSGKRRSSLGVGLRRRGTRVIWRKLDCLISQSPEDAKKRPPERHLLPAPRCATASYKGCRNLRSMGRCPARAIKEMSGTPTSRLRRTTGTNAGSPAGRELHGDGVPIVVVGATTHQGGRESRPQGQGAQVAGCLMAGRYA